MFVVFPDQASTVNIYTPNLISACMHAAEWAAIARKY